MNMRRILDKAYQMTAMYAYRIRIDEEREPSLTDSKIGGIPYWDPAKEYPTDSKGRKLTLLIQINFADLPGKDVFPAEGMLQFFIQAESEFYGSDLSYLYNGDVSSLTRQDGFRVVYHPVINPSVTAETIADLNIPANDTGEPIDGEMAVTFEKAVVSMGYHDYRFMDSVRKAAALLGESEPTEEDVADYFDIHEDEYRLNSGHWLLGYPSFAQEDPRGGVRRSYDCKKLQKYDTMLLQLDTDDSDRIMWGDCGVANFFIEKEALKRGDLSEVMYTWDCG